MDRTHVLRFLRIAVTALSLTVCVLLVARWVKAKWEFSSDVDNWWSYGQISAGERRYKFYSWNGMFVFGMGTFDASTNRHYGIRWPDGNLFPGFGFHMDTGSFCVTVEYLLVALWAAVVAALPWIHWSKRFSLRTLLIAMTLFAVGLGGIVYLAK
jgi:hypothetical protein